MNEAGGVRGVGRVSGGNPPQMVPDALQGNNTPIKPKTLKGWATYIICSTAMRVDSLARNAFIWGIALNIAAFKGAGVPLLLGWVGLTGLSIFLIVGAYLIANDEGLTIIAQLQAASLVPEE